MCFAVDAEHTGAKNDWPVPSCVRCDYEAGWRGATRRTPEIIVNYFDVDEAMAPRHFNQIVLPALTLQVRMRYEFPNGSAERMPAKEYLPVQARFLDRSHKPFRMCIQIR